jgi:protein TonB
MSTPTPAPPRRTFDPSAWRPERRALWWVLGAFVLGLVAFALFVRGRGAHDFFRADTVPPTSANREYAPLPAPLPAGEGTGLQRAPVPVERSEVDVADVEPPPPPPPPREEPRPAERPRPAPSTASREPRPLPGQTPSPDYPARALMRGEGGTALVIVHIGPDGVPTSTDLAQSSGSRELDRAAQQAVRRWRFEPAMADGRPTVGRVVVPIDFRVDR